MEVSSDSGFCGFHQNTKIRFHNTASLQENTKICIDFTRIQRFHQIRNSG